MSAHTTISLPPARALQLRALADAEGCTVTEAVERLINREIEAGRLPDTLPGYEVVVEAGRVRFATEQLGLPPLSPGNAFAAAVLFAQAVTGAIEDGRAKVLTLADGAIKLAVGRKGRGIVGRADHIEGGKQTKFTMTPGMARDLSRQLSAAAHAAKNT